MPITGTFVAGFQVSYAPLPGHDRLDVGAEEPDAASRCVAGEWAQAVSDQLQLRVTGRRGRATVRSASIGLPAPSLLTDQAKGRSDGYIWGMIRNGRGAMPTYNRIEEMERWDVVNYVRGLQAGDGADRTGGLPG